MSCESDDCRLCLQQPTSSSPADEDKTNIFHLAATELFVPEIEITTGTALSNEWDTRV